MWLLMDKNENKLQYYKGQKYDYNQNGKNLPKDKLSLIGAPQR